MEGELRDWPFADLAPDEFVQDPALGFRIRTLTPEEATELTDTPVEGVLGINVTGPDRKPYTISLLPSFPTMKRFLAGPVRALGRAGSGLIEPGKFHLRSLGCPGWTPRVLPEAGAAFPEPGPIDESSVRAPDRVSGRLIRYQPMVRPSRSTVRAAADEWLPIDQ